MTTPTRKTKTSPEANVEPYPEAPPGLVVNDLLALLNDFITYHREQLARSAGPPGVMRSGISAIKVATHENVLVVLEALTEWLAAGCPKPASHLTPEDRKFWIDARDRGLTVPPEIEAQL